MFKIATLESTKANRLRPSCAEKGTIINVRLLELSEMLLWWVICHALSVWKSDMKNDKYDLNKYQQGITLKAP